MGTRHHGERQPFCSVLNARRPSEHPSGDTLASTTLDKTTTPPELPALDWLQQYGFRDEGEGPARDRRGWHGQRRQL